MLGEVFHLDWIETAQSAMEGDEGEVDASDLHALHQFAAEMQTCGRSGHRTLFLRIDRLEILHILLSGGATVDDIARQGGCTQGEELAFELVVRTVVEETQGTSAAGGIVDDLSHHRPVFLKKQFIANTDLTCRLYQHIPQTEVGIQLAQQKHLNLGIGLLLRAIKTGREHLGVVEDKRVVLIEIVDDITEVEIDRIAFLILEFLAILVLTSHLDTTTLTVNDHQTALVTVESRFKGNLLFW